MHSESGNDDEPAKERLDDSDRDSSCIDRLDVTYRQ